MSGSAGFAAARVRASLSAFAAERDHRESSRDEIDFTRSYFYVAGYEKLSAADDHALAVLAAKEPRSAYVRRIYYGCWLDLVFHLRARRDESGSSAVSGFRAELEGSYKAVEAKLSAAFSSGRTFAQLRKSFDIAVSIRMWGGNPDLMPIIRGISTWDDLQSAQYEALLYITCLEQSPATYNTQDMRLSRVTVDLVQRAVQSVTPYRTAQALVAMADLSGASESAAKEGIADMEKECNTALQNEGAAHITSIAAALAQLGGHKALAAIGALNPGEFEASALHQRVAAEQRLLAVTLPQLSTVMHLAAPLLPVAPERVGKPREGASIESRRSRYAALGLSTGGLAVG